MSTGTSGISEESVPLSPSKDCLKFFDQTDLFLKKLDTLKEIIQYRGDVFSKKKEKYQHFVDCQIQNMEKEKEQYLKKNQDLTKKIEESKAQLAELDCSLSQLKIKLSKEKSINEILKQRINLLQSESKLQDEKFYKTSQNYLMVIRWYEDFLNMSIDLDKENYKIISVKFKGSKNFDENPQVKIEILDDNNFKVLKIHPSVEEDEILNKDMSQDDTEEIQELAPSLGTRKINFTALLLFLAILIIYLALCKY